MPRRFVSAAAAVVAVIGSLVATSPAAAEAVEIQVANGSSRAIACRATLAHWFAIDLAEIEPGATGSFALSIDRATGTIAALNAAGDAMPVEQLFCGYRGRVYETRTLLPLRQSLDALPTSPAYHFVCADVAERLVCR